MENSIHSGGLLQRNKKLETLFLVIGFGLFVFMGMRGIQKINNKAVAAGEAYRNAIVQSAVPQQTEESRARLAESAALKQSTTTPQTATNHTDVSRNANANPKAMAKQPDIPSQVRTDVSSEASRVKASHKSLN